MKPNSAAEHAGLSLTLPVLPQANSNHIIERGLSARDDGNDHIIVEIERRLNRFIDGDTITVHLGDRLQQHIVDSRTDQPLEIPYTFKFKARDLPEGRYSVYYKVQEPSYLGGLSSMSPCAALTVANCPGRSDMHLGAIDLRRL